MRCQCTTSRSIPAHRYSQIHFWTQDVLQSTSKLAFDHLQPQTDHLHPICLRLRSLGLCVQATNIHSTGVMQFRGSLLIAAPLCQDNTKEHPRGHLKSMNLYQALLPNRHDTWCTSASPYVGHTWATKRCKLQQSEQPHPCSARALALRQL